MIGAAVAISPRRRREYDRALTRLIRSAAAGESATLRAALAEIQAMQERAALRIAAAQDDWERLQVRDLQRELQVLAADLSQRLGVTLEATIDAELKRTLAAHGAWWELVGLPVPYLGLPPQLLLVSTQTTTTLVQAVTSQQMDAIVVQLQRASLGEVPFQTAIRNLMGTLNPNRFASFGPFRTVRQRAEAILKAEIHRMHSLADEVAYTRLNQDVPGVRYRWEQSFSLHPRESHARTAAVTAEEPIPPDGWFDVGGYKARYPHDPLLPASESVNCSCRKVPVFDAIDWDEIGRRAFAA